MTLPLVACVTCRQTIADGEVLAGLIRLCEHCDAVPWYHHACVGAANCPACGQALTVANEWSTRQPNPHNPAWMQEDRPAQQPAASWENVPARPTTHDAWWTALYTFLQNPPPAAEWDYLGYQHGGHELRWYGESAGVFGHGNVDVHFHIHFTGRTTTGGQPEWTYGSAWITDVHHMDVNIQENGPLHATTLPVLTHHWQSIWATEYAIREADSQRSWR